MRKSKMQNLLEINYRDFYELFMASRQSVVDFIDKNSLISYEIEIKKEKKINENISAEEKKHKKRLTRLTFDD